MQNSKVKNYKRFTRKPAPKKVDEAEEHPEASTTEKKSSRRSPAMRRRANERMDNHRAKLSEQHDAKEKKRIYDELMFGFRSEVEMMRALQICAVPKSVIVPITFRSVGFMSQFLYCVVYVILMKSSHCTNLIH